MFSSFHYDLWLSSLWTDLLCHFCQSQVCQYIDLKFQILRSLSSTVAHYTTARNTQHSHRDTNQNRDILLNLSQYSIFILLYIHFIFYCYILFLFVSLCFQFKGITLWGGKTNRIFSLLFVFQFSRTKYTHRENYINACW